jgi:transcriptional/translational regulatory protein YebC/TACO1
VVSTPVQAFQAVQGAVAERGIEIERAELSMIPSTTIPVQGGDAARLLRLVSAIEDHDDVMNLFTNFEVDDAVLETLGAE